MLEKMLEKCWKYIKYIEKFKKYINNNYKKYINIYKDKQKYTEMHTKNMEKYIKIHRKD